MTLRTCVIVLGRLVRYALHPSSWDGRLHDAFTTTFDIGTIRERNAIAGLVHYPECWDEVTYPTLYDAVFEVVSGHECSRCRDLWGHEGPDMRRRKGSSVASAIADIVRGAALNMMPDVPKVECPSCGRLMVRLSNLERYHCFKCGCWLPFENVEMED